MRRPRVLAWMAVAVVLAIVLSRLPLIGDFGFELAVVTAIFAAVAGADIGGAFARQLQRHPSPTANGAKILSRLVGTSTCAAVAVTLPPGLVALAVGLFTRICDLAFGLTAYALLPLASAALFACVGVAVGLVTSAISRGKPTRWPARVAFGIAPIGVVIGFVLVAVAQFYSAPPVFSYSPVVGFFPGNLYDEEVTLGPALYWSRTQDALAVAGLLALLCGFFDGDRRRLSLGAAVSRRLRVAALLVATACFAGTAVLHRESGRLGFRVNVNDIASFLNGRVETEHFIIHYPKTPGIEADISLLAADHEFRLAQVAAALGVSPRGKIRSFYFANTADKARWMGARDVEMAKPWRREIYLDHRAFPHGSLRHEIAHVVAAEFGDPWFGISARRIVGLPLLANPGLIEGLAVAVDWPGGYDRMFTPHQSVRAMVDLGFPADVRDLFSLRFFSFSSARSYATAGSFLRFLLDTYGAEPVRRLYGGAGDFEAAFGVPMRTLVENWKAMINAVALPAGAAEGMRERFRHGSMFERPCPHAVRDRQREADARFAAGNHAAGVSALRRVCSLDRGEPRHRLALADALWEGEQPAGRDEAVAIWRAVADNADETTSLRAQAALRLVDAAASAGDWQGALQRLDMLDPLGLEETWRRQVVARRISLSHAGPAQGALRDLFFGAAPSGIKHDALRAADIAVSAEPDFGFAYYLRGLRRAEAADAAGATADLERSLSLGLPSRLFVANAARRLAVSAYRARRADAVEVAAQHLSAAEASEVEKALGRDWRERIQFDLAHRAR